MSPISPCQAQHPLHNSKLRLDELQLQDTTGPEAVHNMLHQDLTARFANIDEVCCNMHKQFVDKLIHDVGAVRSLVARQGHQPPEAVNGVGFVQNSGLGQFTPQAYHS